LTLEREANGVPRTKYLIFLEFRTGRSQGCPNNFRRLRSGIILEREAYLEIPFSLKNRSAPRCSGSGIPTSAVWSVRFRAAA
jgi:hypothetical protein